MSTRGFEAVRTAGTGSRLRFLAKDSLLYGLALAGSKLVALALFPILARHFATAEYGVVDAINVLGTVASFLLIVGQDSAVARFFYEVESEAERRQVITQALAIQLCASGLVCIPFVLGTQVVTGRWLGEPECASAYLFQVLSLPALMLGNFCQNLLKWTFARRPFMTLSLGSAALTALLSVAFAVGLGLGVTGVFLGTLLARVLVAACGLWFCRRWLTWPVRTGFLGALLSFGWPYMVSGIALAALPALDRTCILRALDAAQLGLYAAGFRIASMVSLPVAALQVAWNPMSLAIYKERDSTETYDRVLLLSTAVFSILGLGLVLSAEPLLVILASERYRAGAVVVGPLVLGTVFRSLTGIAGLGIDLSKRTYLSTLSYGIGMAAGWYGMLALVGPFGLLGVACGALVGHLVGGASYVAAAYWVYPLRFSLARPLIVLLTCSCAQLLASSLPTRSLAATLLTRAGLLAVVTAALLVLVSGGGRVAAQRRWRERLSLKGILGTASTTTSVSDGSN